MPACMYVRMSACLSVCTYVHAYTYLPTYLPTYVPTYLPIYLPTNQQTNRIRIQTDARTWIRTPNRPTDLTDSTPAAIRNTNPDSRRACTDTLPGTTCSKKLPGSRRLRGCLCHSSSARTRPLLLGWLLAVGCWCALFQAEVHSLPLVGEPCIESDRITAEVPATHCTLCAGARHPK